MKKKEAFPKVLEQMVDLTKQDDIQITQIQDQLVKMPHLALVTSKYFLNLSKYCLTFYHSYKKNSKQLIKNKAKANIRNKGNKEDQQKVPLKKPLTAYILYFQERVSFFQQKYPNYTISELTRLIAKEWKQQDQSAKKPYMERAAIDRKRYESEKTDQKLKQQKKIPQQLKKQASSEQSSQYEQKQAVQEQKPEEDSLGQLI